MIVYIAGNCSYKDVIDGFMKSVEDENGIFQTNILVSYFYRNEIHYEYLPRIRNLLLDSGAFSYMTGVGGKSANFDEYLEGYISFINEHGIEMFFELDVDSIVGYEKVLEMRRRLEEGTGKKCIPVWHASRGKDEFLRMVDEYDYVAFGGLLTDGIPDKMIVKAAPWFIEKAHENGAKIHGLGFNRTTLLDKIKFDSVDSSSALLGNRFGTIYKFKKNGIMSSAKKSDGMRIKDHRKLMLHNLKEYQKLIDYAFINL